MTDSQKLDQILYILQNDEKTGRIGLVQTVNENEQRLDQLLEQHRYSKFQTGFFGFIGGCALWVFSFVFDNFIKNK